MISGSTKILLMIGHPVSQTLSPSALNRYFSNCSLDIRMVGADFAPFHATSLFKTMRQWGNCLGASITIPLKQLAFEHCDVFSERARRLSVVNTIRRDPVGRLVGEMTDGLAMVSAIRRTGIDLAGKSALVVGAGGGAGSAIADALCEAGISTLYFTEASSTKAERILRTLPAHYPDIDIRPDTPDSPVNIAVNASPLGMATTDPIPISVDLVAKDGVVADAVTKPAETPLLAAARRAAIKTVSGADMVKGQLAFQLRHWNIPCDIDFSFDTS